MWYDVQTQSFVGPPDERKHGGHQDARANEQKMGSSMGEYIR